MKIFLDMINSPKAIVNKDHRYAIFKQLLPIWKKNGHTIYLSSVDKPAFDRNLFKIYNKFQEKHKPIIDLYICFGIYNEGRELAKYFEENGKKVITFEHSWLNSSMIIERNKLFSDSYFYHKLKDVINENYNEQACLEYINSLKTSNLSKRPQPKNAIIPDEIKGKYVFLPYQKSSDMSIRYYSKIQMFDFVSKVVDYLKPLNIPLVLKTHPHVKKYEKELSNQNFREMKNKYDNIYLINTSVYDLMDNALFTVCLNSGTLIDNFVTQTPVLTCAESLFTDTYCAIYTEDVNEGMKRMIEKNYDFEVMKLNQRKIVYWLKNHLLFSNISAQENQKRFEYLSGIKL